MKKFVLALILFVCGFLGTIVLIAALVCSPESPWLVNGVVGIYSGITFMKLQLPIIVSLLMEASGLALAIKEACSNK